jgi:hypothetical protein
MYLFLLVLGAALTAAGIVLAASGVSIHERVFDMTIVTPGIVAAVGGLLLIGLGLALRVLRRIEQAVAARPMPRRGTRPGEVAEPAAAPSEPAAARIAFPAKPASRRQPAPVATPAPPAPLVEGRLEELPEKLPPELPEKLPQELPALARFESTRVVQQMDLSLLPRGPSSVDEAVAEVDNKARAARWRNGAAPTRITPRLDLGARSPISSERPKGPAFDALWPKGPRPTRAAQSSAPAQAAAAPVVEPEQSNEAAVDALQAVAQDAAPAPLSILKSGVVDGMAYSLYSDGSIEAQLPQGTLRFGSITELRNHIEQDA